MTLPGYATPEGTRRFAERAGQKPYIAAGHFRETADGLHLSSLGMGTYLGDLTPEVSEEMTRAAVASIESGCVNVIDTAINYRYQLSERSIAAALREVIAAGVRRDELFISSKNGFLAPDAQQLHTQEDFQRYVVQNLIEPGTIQPDDIVGGMHCMTPAYLNDQLNRTLENLGLETLDLMYLHNAAESQMPVVGREAFMSGLRAAFEFYESARAAGRIRYYGLATWNCFRVPPEETQQYLALEEVVQLAQQVGGDGHGFRYIQLPFNLAFIEALGMNFQTVNGQRISLLEAALDLGIGVFTSVPLLQGQLLQQPRLPQFQGLETPAQVCLQFVRSNPGVLAPLVGHKQPHHVEENLKVASVPPLSVEAFQAMLSPQAG